MFDVIEKTYLDDSRRLELKVSWRGISITDDRLYKYWSSANPEIPEADKCEYVSECSDFIACWEVLCKLFDKYDKPIWIYITDDQSFFGYVIKGTLYTVGIHDYRFILPLIAINMIYLIKNSTRGS